MISSKGAETLMRLAAPSRRFGRPGRWTLALGAVTLLLVFPGCKSNEAVGEPSLRRLTPTEYNSTIRDLFGWPLLERVVAGSPSDYEDAEAFQDALAKRLWTFPQELGQDGFEGFGEQQVASPYFVEQVEAAAAYFAPMALDAPHFSTCLDVATRWEDIPEDQQPGCQWDSVIRFAHRAYRRPLDLGETERLKSFFDRNLAEFGHANGTVLTLQGLLQAPAFLYLLEPPPSADPPASAPAAGGVTLTGPWETASRLSYFLWDSMPDPALFEAASRDELKTKEQVEAQARRMLDDPRAREAVVHFHEQWLEIDKVFANRAYLTTYGPRYMAEFLDGIDPESEGADLEVAETWSAVLIGWRFGMAEEARLFVERTIFEGGPGGGRLADLLTGTSGYVTELEFATGYARPQSGSGAELLDEPSYLWTLNDGTFPLDLQLKPATFPAEQRAGLLTLPALLAGRAHPIHPAPVLRGKLVLERIACVPLGQPPPGAVGQAPPDSLEAANPNRARLEAVTGVSGCSSCHNQLNPLGYAFENFDSLGGWRDSDNGQPIDASGIARLGSEPAAFFSGPVALAQHLAQSEAVHHCYTRHWVRNALGRSETDQEDTALSALQTRFKDGDGDIRELLVAIAGSELFRQRRQTTDEGSEQ
jgi:hypothetical protein